MVQPVFHQEVPGHLPLTGNGHREDEDIEGEGWRDEGGAEGSRRIGEGGRMGREKEENGWNRVKEGRGREG